MQTDQSVFSDNEMLLLHKPKGWTSFDVIRKIKKESHIKKVGHAGTLDPLATGLMIVATGIKTKTLEQFIKLDKEYIAQITLGATTPTFDLESEPQNHKSFSTINTKDIENVLKNLVGDIFQTPPIFSAIKKQGKPLYLLARKGAEVIVEPRKIFIHSIEILEYKAPELSLKIHCSSGTYIRSLANDIGEMLKCGAYLSALSRTKIGNYFLENAIVIESNFEKIKPVTISLNPGLDIKQIDS